MNIPAGYMLTITTSENDYDNVKDKHIYGLSENDVKFYIGLLEQFRINSYGRSDEAHLGNSCRGQYNEYNAIVRAYEHCPPDSEELKSDIDYILENGKGYESDFLYDLIGFWNDGTWRVFEDVVVHWIPEKLKECTAQFVGDTDSPSIIT